MATDQEVEEAVAALDALDRDNPDRAHSEADAILLGLVPAAVSAAYERLTEECAWWVTS